mmetsp:Transcript_64746/g.173157  ORF Transcript_64746/g.173157 Transcript_64746/m.173157 type:complete len:204 (+) Transcript_64746:195-806(+)
MSPPSSPPSSPITPPPCNMAPTWLIDFLGILLVTMTGKSSKCWGCGWTKGAFCWTPAWSWSPRGAAALSTGFGCRSSSSGSPSMGCRACASSSGSAARPVACVSSAFGFAPGAWNAGCTACPTSSARCRASARSRFRSCCVRLVGGASCAGASSAPGSCACACACAAASSALSLSSALERILRSSLRILFRWAASALHFSASR